MMTLALATACPGLCFIAASGVNLGPLVTTVAMLGKFSVTVSMAFMVLYTKEYFPTNLRLVPRGVNHSSVFCLVGTCIVASK